MVTDSEWLDNQVTMPSGNGGEPEDLLRWIFKPGPGNWFLKGQRVNVLGFGGRRVRCNSGALLL